MRFYCKKQEEGHFFMICYADNFAPDADGRCRTTMAALRLQMAELKPELAFKPEYAVSDETFSLWQKKVRARLEERLKMPPVDPSQPPPKILKKNPGTVIRSNTGNFIPINGVLCRLCFCVRIMCKLPCPP